MALLPIVAMLIAIIAKLAKAMSVILILICVGGMIVAWMGKWHDLCWAP
ncbi:MAG: hypothetical protein ACR5LD_08745 [Symbiopectobacterium sp.]